VRAANPKRYVYHAEALYLDGAFVKDVESISISFGKLELEKIGGTFAEVILEYVVKGESLKRIFDNIVSSSEGDLFDKLTFSEGNYLLFKKKAYKQIDSGS